MAKDAALVTRRQLRKQAEEEACLDIMRRVANKAARVVEGLFVEAGAPNYNADAEKPWGEATTKTRAALAICKDEVIQSKLNSGAPVRFGVIVLAGRAESLKQWEAESREAQAIDVEVEDK